jgi:hypothetical protein
LRGKKEFLSLIFSFLIASLIPALLSAATHNQEKQTSPIYDYIKETSWITMKNGVRLSATFYKPVSRSPIEMIKSICIKSIQIYFFRNNRLFLC